VICPRCGNPKVCPLASGFHWQCEQCAKDGYRFSGIAGTIFENTNKPLRDWFKVTHLMRTSKKGKSALQIMRFMGFGSYKTARGMCHKIRTAVVEPEAKLGGIVELDETFVGGKFKKITISASGAETAARPVLSLPAKSRSSVPSSAKAT
jgi:hypothetical protein